jgi:hypothetical protein
MIRYFGFQSDVSVFLGSDFFGFSRIVCALQQYKDAKPFMLIISYSTEVVKPSIFGTKKPLNGFEPGGFLRLVSRSEGVKPKNYIAKTVKP